MVMWGSSPAALATRFTAVANRWVPDGPAERIDRARRNLLSTIASREPATLKEVAAAVRRGAPAVSRSVETLVRAGLVERSADPANRRRLALKLTEAGRSALSTSASAGGKLEIKLGRLAQSELRAVERALEILERG